MTIQLHAAELASYGESPLTWLRLSYAERRFMASAILRKRGDAKSSFNARQIEFANPNFNRFVIVQ